jgi:hypothetical protein
VSVPMRRRPAPSDRGLPGHAGSPKHSSTIVRPIVGQLHKNSSSRKLVPVIDIGPYFRYLKACIAWRSKSVACREVDLTPLSVTASILNWSSRWISSREFFDLPLEKRCGRMWAKSRAVGYAAIGDTALAYTRAGGALDLNGRSRLQSRRR